MCFSCSSHCTWPDCSALSARVRPSSHGASSQRPSLTFSQKITETLLGLQFLPLLSAPCHLCSGLAPASGLQDTEPILLTLVSTPQSTPQHLHRHSAPGPPDQECKPQCMHKGIRTFKKCNNQLILLSQDRLIL